MQIQQDIKFDINSPVILNLCLEFSAAETSHSVLKLLKQFHSLRRFHGLNGLGGFTARRPAENPLSAFFQLQVSSGAESRQNPETS